MTRIYSPTQLSLFSTSRLGAWWEEFDRNNKIFNFPQATELEKRLMLEGDNHEKMLIEKFKKEKNCENYLTKVVVKNFTNMKVMQEDKNKYLSNLSKNKFIICKKLEYPILNTKLQK